MTRYAVGDLQGCLKPLQCLLNEVDFNPEHDQLWCVGDLINRGPESLATLRYLKALSDQHPASLRVVLGNHDLHFLAVARGATQPRRGDTFEQLLAAADLAELVAWLRQQPLIYSDPSADYSMVHAGIPPTWTLDDSHRYAREVEAVLQSDAIDPFFANMYGNSPDCWSEELSGWPRLRLITNYFTRMRFCSAQGRLDLLNKTDHHDDPEMAPWFSFQQRKTNQQQMLFGHWASLEGKADSDNVFALDTGCVWGGAMTLLNLEDQSLHRCQCDQPATAAT